MSNRIAIHIVNGALRHVWCDTHLASEAAMTIYAVVEDRITPVGEWRDCEAMT